MRRHPLSRYNWNSMLTTNLQQPPFSSPSLLALPPRPPSSSSLLVLPPHPLVYTYSSPLINSGAIHIGVLQSINELKNIKRRKGEKRKKKKERKKGEERKRRKKKKRRNEKEKRREERRGGKRGSYPIFLVMTSASDALIFESPKSQIFTVLL